MRRHLPAGEAPIVPSLVFPEVAGALSRRLGKLNAGLRAVSQIKRLNRLRVVDFDQEIMDQSTLLAATHGLRGADATYVAVAQRYAVSLLTWDRDQPARAGQVVAATTPREDDHVR